MHLNCSLFAVIVCCSLSVLVDCKMTSREVRQKRSDDRDPLEAVVQQLSAQVGHLNAQLSAQANHFNDQLSAQLSAQANHFNDQLSAQENLFNAQLTQQANSFTAQLNSVNAEVAALKNKTDPLEAVVEQLSAQANHLNAKLSAQENDLNAQLIQQANSFNAEVAALNRKTDTLSKTVAFHAWSNDNPVQTPAHSRIIGLNHTATNIGNAYDTHTGIFTAPVSGLYNFQATIMIYDPASDEPYVHAAMYVDEDKVAEAYSEGHHGYYSQPAVSAVVHVNAGQKVYLWNTKDFTSEYYGDYWHPYTTFSGFLIKAD